VGLPGQESMVLAAASIIEHVVRLS